MASLFTQIIEGRLLAYRVYEDDKIIAILAKDQIRLGHTIVIPKQEFDQWCDVDPEIFAYLQVMAQKIGRAIRAATQCERVLTAAIGYEVKHYHLHLIPSWSMADLNFSLAKSYPAEEMNKVLDQIKAKLL